MLNPFVTLLASIISLYNMVIIIWVVVSLLIHFDIINRYQPFVAKVVFILTRLVEPALAPIRRFLRKILPDLGGIDLSPIVLILLLQFIQNALYTYFYNIGVSS